MTGHGEKIADLTVEDVVGRLREETDGKAVKRLVAAREYLAGSSVTDVAEKYGWPEQTVYDWLDRFEERPLEEALYDDRSPGRPPALDEREFERFANAIQSPPSAVGIDAPEWSTDLARAYLDGEFGCTFSRRHVRRLLAAARRSP